MTKKLLIISDSHGNNEIIEKIIKKEKPEIIIHAGDYCTNEEWMNTHITYYVDGNNDYHNKRSLLFNIFNYKFYLLHSDELFSFNQITYENRLINLAKENQVDVLIFGHTHVPYIKDDIKPYLINPGSLSYPRQSNGNKAYVIALVSWNQIKFELKTIK